MNGNKPAVVHMISMCNTKDNGGKESDKDTSKTKVADNNSTSDKNTETVKEKIIAHHSKISISILKKAKTSILTRSQTFQTLVKWAFEQVDTDNSGTIDKKELYAGLLLIHLHLASYAGPAACEPVTREYVEEIFDAMDTDRSGDLDEDEFLQLMMIMCSQILTRVAMQWALTLMIVPLIADAILDLIKLAVFSVWDIVDDIPIISTILSISHRIGQNTPTAFNYFLAWLDFFIPDNAVSSIPLAIISCILGISVVPWFIFKIDSFFKRTYQNNDKIKTI